jgi:hypothetical protein
MCFIHVFHKLVFFYEDARHVLISFKAFYVQFTSISRDQSNFRPVLHPAIRTSTCYLRAKIGQIARCTQGTRAVRADHTRRPAEDFWHVHNFLRAPCNFRFAVSPLVGTCTEKERYRWRSSCACRKFKMIGERRKVASKQLRDTYLCLTFHLCSLVLVKCVCHVACKRDSRTGTHSICRLKVSCSNFGCSVRVQ